MFSFCIQLVNPAAGNPEAKPKPLLRNLFWRRLLSCALVVHCGLAHCSEGSMASASLSEMLQDCLLSCVCGPLPSCQPCTAFILF